MNRDKLLLGIGTIAVIGVAGAGGYYLFAATADQAARPTGTSQSADSSDATGASDSSAAASYQDGTYSQTVDYHVPEGGTNTLHASLTIKDGVVTAVDTTTDYEDRESVQYIDSSESGISGAVVGESLDGLSVSRIGSSSLTASAFNDVLDAVRDDAAA